MSTANPQLSVPAGKLLSPFSIPDNQPIRSENLPRLRRSITHPCTMNTSNILDDTDGSFNENYMNGYTTDSSYEKPTAENLTFADYRHLERLYGDSLIKIKDLIREQEQASDELEEKKRQVESKTLKINELLQENTSLMGQLRKERELNEKEFNSWSDLKADLESKVANLRDALNKKDGDGAADTVESIVPSLNQLSSEEMAEKHHHEVEKLQKRVMILAKENELEVHSKMLIIDELEMVKERSTQLYEKYKSLKTDYDTLVDEFGADFEASDDGSTNIPNNEGLDVSLARKLSTLTDGSLGASDDDNNTGGSCVVMTDGNSNSTSATVRSPTGRKTSSSSSVSAATVIRTKSLASELEQIAKPLNVSKQRQVSRASTKSLRASSLTKFIKDVKLQSLQRKHTQEVMKLKFQIRSLELQNEKLHSYIGFVLQRLDKHNKTNSSFEYSDEINIRNAKRSLHRVVHSASAYPIRPITVDDGLQASNNYDNPKLGLRRSLQSFHRHSHTGDGFIGASASGGNTGNELSNSCLLVNSDSDSLSSDFNVDESAQFANHNLSGSIDAIKVTADQPEVPDANESLSVSFKMDLTPSLSLKKRKKSAIFKHSPVNQLQKLSAFNSMSNLHESSKIEEEKVKQRASLMARSTSNGTSGSDMDEIDRDFIINEVSEGEVSDAGSIPEDELDRFKIVAMRKVFHPKHSIADYCFKPSGEIDPEYFYMAISPVLALKRSLNDYYRRKHGKNSIIQRKPSRILKHSRDTDEDYEADESDYHDDSLSSPINKNTFTRMVHEGADYEDFADSELSESNMDQVD